MYIAENLKTLRRGRDLTQEEAAEALGVSAQSVSKWERGDTCPDITLLPALANFYRVSIDALVGMDRINDSRAREAVFAEGHRCLRDGDPCAAAAVFAGALKTFPSDEGFMAELAFALALGGDAGQLRQAAALCEAVLSGQPTEKLRHTTRAALCFIYQKAGETDKAMAAARSLPHRRECRESVLAELAAPNTGNIDDYLRLIILGECNEQDAVAVEFGAAMTALAAECDLPAKIRALRGEAGGGSLPRVRLRDNLSLAPGRVRVRWYADSLLDMDFSDPDEAAERVVEALRRGISSRAQGTG